MISYFTKGLIVCVSLFTFSALASEHCDQYGDCGKDKLLFKVRGAYLYTSGKNSKFSPVPDNSLDNIKKLTQHGYIIDTAANYFVMDNVAVELSLGVGGMSISSSALKSVQDGYNSAKDVGKNSVLYFIPVNAMLQFHVAPYGAFRPYLGVGYNVSWMYSRSKMFKVDHAHGLVAQVGIDWVYKDNTVFTLDVKQFFLNPKVTYTTSMLDKQAKSKWKWNPLTISFGVGFQF